MNRKEQITTEFQKRLKNEEDLQEKLEKAVTLFRAHWKAETPSPIDKFQTDARTAFFKIAELVTRTYSTKEKWDEKENLFITSYSRESTANLRPMHESSVIDEIKRNVLIGYSEIVKDEAEAEREFNDLCGVIKKYYSQFWKLI